MQREDWDDLRFILAVAEEGTVSGAAKRLNVNHATVLRRIAQFEESAGTQVFDKTARGYALAADKLRMLDATRDVDRAVQAVLRLLSGARAPMKGDVRVTSTDSFCAVLLPPILSRIGESAPELRVSLLSSNTHADLGRSQADIAIRPTPSLPDELIGERVGTLAFAPFAAKGHERPERWLGLAGLLERSVAARWMAEAVSPDAILGAADSFLTLREMAATGGACAFLPCFLGDADTRLARIDGLAPPMAVNIWVASHVDLADVPRIAVMRRLLSEALIAEAPRLAGIRD